MNFLALCQRLRQESGSSGSGPASVKDQTGESKRIVDWIVAGYEDIQNFHPNWQFLQQSFNFTMTIGKRNYTPAEAGVTNHESWKLSDYGDFRNYIDPNAQDEQYLYSIPWNEYRLNYLYGTNRTTTGRPKILSVKPDKSLDFFQIPDKAYIVDGEYYQQPDIMEENEDVPIFPSQFHLIIVWRALMFYGAYEAADERYSHGQNEYKKLLRKLEGDQLTKMTYGAPLA